MTIPKGINKQQFKGIVAAWESRHFKNPVNTISQALDDPKVVEVWDLSKINASELVSIQEKHDKNSQSTLFLIHIKK